MLLPRNTTTHTMRSPSPKRIIAGAAVALTLFASACGGSSTPIGDIAVASDQSSDTAPASTDASAESNDAAEAAPTAVVAAEPTAIPEPDPELPTELTIALTGPGLAPADGLVAHAPATCDASSPRQQFFDFAVPTDWNNDIGNWSGSNTSTIYQANLSEDGSDDVDIRNQEFMLIQVSAYINHGRNLFGEWPTLTPEVPVRTPWFQGEDLNPLTVIGEANVGGSALPIYHSQTQDIEDKYGQIGGDIAVWQVTGTAATWPVPEKSHAGTLDYRIMVATDYTRTDLPADYRIGEEQAIGIIESVQASQCMRQLLIDAAANHISSYVIE